MAKDCRSEDFKECSDCARKPGTPTLCEACLNNRGLIYRLKSLADKFQKEADRYRAALVTISEQSVKCEGPNCVWCEDEKEHPPTWEAKLAKQTLERRS